MRAVPSRRPARSRSTRSRSPSCSQPDDAIVRVEASGICGSDLHIYHGRVQIEPGFVIGHEFVGEVVAAGDDVSRVAVGDRVLGTYGTACGKCFFCRREEFHKCDEARVFGHGKALGDAAGSAGGAAARAAREPRRCARSPTASPTTWRCSPAT